MKMNIIENNKFVEIEKEYNDGLSLTKIAKRHSMCRPTVRKFLEDKNIDIRPNRTYFFNEDFFDEINTEEKAYIFGFLMADGCNNKCGNIMEVWVNTKDKDIILKIQKCIGKAVPTKTRRGLHDSVGIVFCSKKMCSRLNDIGMTPAKSLTCEFPMLEGEMLKHFIRGYFDGDGSIAILNPPKDRKSGSINVEVCSSMNFAIKFVELMQNILEINFKIRAAHNVTGSRITRRQDVLKFLNWIYKDSTIYLDRKYNRYLEVVPILEEKLKLYKYKNQ